MVFSYRCPFCNQNATITSNNYSEDLHFFHNDNKYGHQQIRSFVIVCPNPDCKEYSLQITLHDREMNAPIWKVYSAKRSWKLIPQSDAKVLPKYIPAPIVQDYREACAIKNLSPKASATLARRCMQGIIRDFWGISKRRLIDEIDTIREKVDPLTWGAIDAVRKVGNIGAHMEADINVIVDVDPEEAKLLIELIETLVQDWYVVTHDRKQRLRKIVDVSKEKEGQRSLEPIIEDEIDEEKGKEKEGS